ncbi:MAG TPA: hypothetical protein PLL69_12245, partial [Gemmatimonadales bacterium]|nr:hypothetical protein [Gemmatimonadales bacterium]
MSAFRTALLVLLMSSCVEPGGQPDSRGESGSGRKERMTALVPLVMADGGAARSARSEGLTTIPSQMASDAVVYWPGSEPLSGFQAIEYALSQAPWSGESRFYWQPLMLRNAPGLGLVAGVLTADGPVVNGGQL